MRARRRAFALFVFATSALLACSGNSSSVEREDAGSVGHGIVVDAGNDEGPSPDAPSVDAAPAACWVVQPSDPGVQDCVSCSQSACKSAWVSAYGSSFFSGDFRGGACADEAQCTCACRSDDAVCIEACDISEPSACRSAKQAIHDCEGTSCAVACNRG